MIDKIAGLARVLAVLLAIVAAAVALPANINVGLVLLVLGLVAGLLYAAEDAVRLFVVVIVLVPVGSALGIVPEIGDRLTALAGNLALAAAGASATVIARRVWKNSLADITGLTAKK